MGIERELYQPSQEEVKKAEGIMTEEEKVMRFNRNTEITMSKLAEKHKKEKEPENREIEQHIKEKEAESVITKNQKEASSFRERYLDEIKALEGRGLGELSKIKLVRCIEEIEEIEESEKKIRARFGGGVGGHKTMKVSAIFEGEVGGHKIIMMDVKFKRNDDRIFDLWYQGRAHIDGLPLSDRDKGKLLNIVAGFLRSQIDEYWAVRDAEKDLQEMKIKESETKAGAILESILKEKYKIL